MKDRDRSDSVIKQKLPPHPRLCQPSLEEQLYLQQILPISTPPPLKTIITSLVRQAKVEEKKKQEKWYMKLSENHGSWENFLHVCKENLLRATTINPEESQQKKVQEK